MATQVYTFQSTHNFMNKCLNFQSEQYIMDRFGISYEPNILIYKNCYDEFIQNPTRLKQFIFDNIEKYVINKYTTINVVDADINYYLTNINDFVKNKFSDVMEWINIKHLISLNDYATSSKKNYLYWREEYYKIIYKHIMCGKYGSEKCDAETELLKLIEENWTKINFTNIMEFTKTLSKLKFFNQNINDYMEMIVNKFDDKNNIARLLEHIMSVFHTDIKSNKQNNGQDNKKDDKKDDKKDNEMEQDVMILGEEPDDNIIPSTFEKYNFRFIVDNLKSNGYLLFEEYKSHLFTKYKKPQTINVIIGDKRLINYFAYLVSKKDANSVNRQVNEILVRMRDYLYDIEDNYSNNIGYQKIQVKQESEKYKSVDLSSYNRANANFNIFKYSHTNTNLNPIKKYTLNSKIEPYFDIYKAFYASRYPDREIEFDLFQSTLIIKMKFSKIYYIHLALIQYIVLDKIFTNSEPIGLVELSSQTQISIENLQETINSLLQIKIISRSNAKSIEDLKFSINQNFEHANNKISIGSLVIKEDTSNNTSKPREFLHDRNTIVLANLCDYAKKNKTFTRDVLGTELQYKIPFGLTFDMIEAGLKNLLETEFIQKITLPSPYGDGSSQEIYKYVV